MRGETGAGTRLNALDGVRALSALSVFVYHNSKYHETFSGGGAGVEVFFILSGFLITALLYREWSETGRIDFVGFYWRRFVRLVPAAAFFFVCLWAYLVLFQNEPYIQTNPFLFSLTPVDIVKAAALHFNSLTNYWLKGGEAFSPITHLWSLSVEQQFYLVWPLALLGLLRFNRFYVTCVVLLAIGLASMSIDSLWTARDHVDGQALQLVEGVAAPVYSLAFGALAGLVWARHGSVRVPSVALLMAGAALLARIAYPLPNVLLDRLVVEAGAIIVILGCAGGRGLAVRVLELKPLVHLGQRSYGFYLWHLPFVWWVMPLDGPLQLFWAFTLTLAMAELSYRYVEQPAMTWGRRFQAAVKGKTPRPQAIEAGVAAVAA